jgi:hypothetical protein
MKEQTTGAAVIHHPTSSESSQVTASTDGDMHPDICCSDSHTAEQFTEADA